MSRSAALEALALPGAIQSWKSGTDERCVFVCVWMCGQAVLLSSPCLLILFIYLLSLYPSPLLASLHFFYPRDSHSVFGFPFFPFLDLVFSSSFVNLVIPLSTSLPVSSVFVASSPSALVLLSILLQRSADCDDGGGRESAHWFF